MHAPPLKVFKAMCIPIQLCFI